jgi:hypothetical protein
MATEKENWLGTASDANDPDLTFSRSDLYCLLIQQSP